jgi:TrmH RNA methyltransferase
MNAARKELETKVYGAHAVHAVYTRRPDDILRVYLLEERIPHFSEMLRHCAGLRRPYKVVAPDELEKVTESTHHEGICVMAKARPAVRLEDAVAAPGPACVLGLVDVGNPHNVGAILRSAAHFDARAVVLFGDLVRLPAAAARTAEGGAEWLDIVLEPNPGRALRTLRAAGFMVCATTSGDARPLFATPLPPRTLLLVGAEDEGLPDEALAQADLVLQIAGSGHVESLNVAAASAVLLGEFFRQHGRKP